MPAGDDVPESPGRCCSSALQAESGSCQQRTLLFNKFLQDLFWDLLWLFSLMFYRVFDVLGQFVTLTKLILVED